MVEGLGHMTKMATMPIKNLLKIFSGTKWPMTLKLGMQHCWLNPIIVSERIELNLFYDKVKFGHLGFCVGGKKANSGFF